MTVSLETARKLKEVGFPQEATFYWVYGAPYKTELSYGRLIVGKGKDATEICEHVAAPTTDELLARLPRDIRDKKGLCQAPLRIYFGAFSLSVSYHQIFNPPVAEFKGEILCEALAQMWLWLRKEGLVK